MLMCMSDGGFCSAPSETLTMAVDGKVIGKGASFRSGCPDTCGGDNKVPILVSY